MQYPSLTRSTVRHIELVPMGAHAADGRAHRQHAAASSSASSTPAVDLSDADGEQLVAASAAAVNADAAGRASPTRPRRCSRCRSSSSRPTATSCGPSSRSLDDALVEEREERVVLAGTANLARVGTDFPLTIGPVLEALEEHVVLLKLLGTARRRLRRGRGAHRPREPVRRAAVHLGRLAPATAPARDLRRRPRGARPDPDGLPHDDGVGARRRHLRLRDPRAVTRVHRAPHRRPSVHQGHSLNDYYQDLGVARDAEPGGHQARLPQAGRASCTPTSTPAPRPRSSSRRSPRPTTCSPTPRSAGPTTWAPTPTAARRPAASARASRSATSWTPSSAAGAGRPRRGPRSRQRRGQDALIRLDIDLAQAVFGAERGADHRHRGRLRAPATATAPQPGTGTPHLRRLRRSRRDPAGAALASSAR